MEVGGQGVISLLHTEENPNILLTCDIVRRLEVAPPWQPSLLFQMITCAFWFLITFKLILSSVDSLSQWSVLTLVHDIQYAAGVSFVVIWCNVLKLISVSPQDLFFNSVWSENKLIMLYFVLIISSEGSWKQPRCCKCSSPNYKEKRD